MPDEKQDELSKTQKLPAYSAPASQQEEPSFKAEQQRIDNMIAAHAPLHEILSNLVLMIESQSPNMLCSILLISEDGDHVKHAVGPSLPQDYMRAIDGLAIGPKHGSCGTAMWRGKPVVCTDIATDPLWEDYRQYALASDLAACWSTPIMSSKGKVLGTFAMYYRNKRGPTELETHFTDVATKLAAKAIQSG